mmetsp:Transcript_6195/g.18762  ORF Transcript_6195/g.18762 Transcript_6195/m.18762 type:complete len:375 (-) Transcript_6195:15-1139(-)
MEGPSVKRCDVSLLALAHAMRSTVFQMCELGWEWPNVGFSLAAWTSFMSSYRFVATLLLFVLVVRLVRFPEGEMRRNGAPHSLAKLPTCLTHYAIVGPPDGSLVIACHGFSGDLSHTMPLARRLAHAGHRVLVYDLVGRGFSSCRDRHHAAELFVSQLAELVLALGLADRPAHLVGISLGGGVVSAYATYFPRRVASLTLIASVGLPLCTSAHVLTKIPLVPDLLFRFALWTAVVAGLEHEWADTSNASLDAMLQNYRDRVRWEPALGRSLLSTARHFPLETLHDTFADIGRAAYPVMILWGDNDRTCPVANAATLRSYIPRAHLIVVPGARHCVYTEFCPQVASALLSFLRTLLDSPDAAAPRGAALAAPTTA